jgi:hypothetical protein
MMFFIASSALFVAVSVGEALPEKEAAKGRKLR